MSDVATQVAQQYLSRVQVKPDFISAACPFHDESTPGAFWISRQQGNWGCFSCGARGGSITWLLRELGVKDQRAEALVSEAEDEASRTKSLREAQAERERRRAFEGSCVLPESLLGVYDYTPLDLVEAGFDETLLREHDIGFDVRNNRITVPLRDLSGNLVGISGRAIGDERPKYKVYEGRRTYDDGSVRMNELGEWFPGYRSEGARNHLWRAHRVFPTLNADPGGRLFVVEGYKAALWMVQNGFPTTVALTGAQLSFHQQRIIRRLGVATWIFLDENEAGREGTKRIIQSLGDSTFPVFECTYPETEENESRQPDDLSRDELERVISTAERAVARRRRR